ncbi:MAG: 7-cyano-7-deazaguanine synthase [Saprospiraceae bacterium]
MCGIFGIRAVRSDAISPEKINAIIKTLGYFSETRGKDASGLAAFAPFTAVKSPNSFSVALKEGIWQTLLKQVAEQTFKGENAVQMLIGHTRLATNGAAEDAQNNQPVQVGDMIGVHNGIICNTEPLAAYYGVTPKSQLDTEVLFLAIERELERQLATGLGRREAWKAAIIRMNDQIEGAASVALITALGELVLFTNTGSLYTADTAWGTLFSSERLTLEDVLHKIKGKDNIPAVQAHAPLSIIYFDASEISGGKQTAWEGIPASARSREMNAPLPVLHLSSPLQAYLRSEAHLRRLDTIAERVGRLRRCRKCLLPETHPFIAFDEQGICNHCRTYMPIEMRPKADLFQLADRIRSANGRADCIVPLSGGRDSTFILSKVKRELGLNPVAYSYDWGLVTDLARRNQSRLCQALGVEHIVISADIRKKRSYVRKNVRTWLKNPDLGVIPLFMAGDKMFFTHANTLAQKLGIDSLFFGMNEFENNDFKEGFCGVNRRRFNDRRFYGLNFAQQAKMIAHYGKQFLSNPGYLNDSIPDTAFAYFAYYFAEHNYHLFFKYYPWNEKEVQDHIISEYNFELSPDTDSSWRIGDGTAAFYNYIYYSLAGFSESEPMRSNQIREGQITREEGLRLIEADNRPRYASLQWYCETIGLDPLAVIQTIDKMPFVENRWTV